jgi:hypothetical protein
MSLSSQHEKRLSIYQQGMMAILFDDLRHHSSGVPLGSSFYGHQDQYNPQGACSHDLHF